MGRKDTLFMSDFTYMYKHVIFKGCATIIRTFLKLKYFLFTKVSNNILGTFKNYVLRTTKAILTKIAQFHFKLIFIAFKYKMAFFLLSKTMFFFWPDVLPHLVQ